MHPELPSGASRPVDRHFDAVYDELKRIAHRQLRAIDARATLCATELVHEAYRKPWRADDVTWDGPARFHGAAARAMRQVLVDFARRRSTGSPLGARGARGAPSVSARR